MDEWGWEIINATSTSSPWYDTMMMVKMKSKKEGKSFDHYLYINFNFTLHWVAFHVAIKLYSFKFVNQLQNHKLYVVELWKVDIYQNIHPSNYKLFT